MKNITYIFFLFISSNILLAQGDAISKLFNNYSDDESFSTVYISPKMFKMIATISGDEAENEIAEVSRDIETLRIISTSEDAKSFYNKANKILNNNAYEELMTVKEKGQDVRFVTRSEGDIIRELILLVGSDDNFVMLNFTGKIDLEKISRLAGKLNIEGSDQLGKLNKKQ